MSRAVIAVVMTAVMSIACAGSGDDPLVVPTLVPQPGGDVEIPPLPPLDESLVTEGAALYAAHCAECHGDDLRGDPDWMRPAADDGYRPPPHDSTGHTWHHPDQLLIQIVLTGYGFDEPRSRMPTFSGRLEQAQVVAILEFIKSHWGPEERGFQWEQTVRWEADGR